MKEESLFEEDLEFAVWGICGLAEKIGYVNMRIARWMSRLEKQYKVPRGGRIGCTLVKFKPQVNGAIDLKYRANIFTTSQ